MSKITPELIVKIPEAITLYAERVYYVAASLKSLVVSFTMASEFPIDNEKYEKLVNEYIEANTELSLALTKIKIDRTFITGIDENPTRYKIVKSLVALSSDMQLECIAEGVETREELEALISLGCFFVQGYYFSQPMHHSHIDNWLKDN